MHSMDLLGRKVVAEQGSALRLLGEEVTAAARRARTAGVDAEWVADLERAVGVVGEVTMHLATLGMGGKVEDMMRHSVDYLDLFSTVAIAWQWVLQAAVAKEALAASRGPAEFYAGKIGAAQYWIKTELPRIDHLAHLCRSGEDSYARMAADWF
jgi:butyryl-CoA dehydrogenase